MSIRTASDFRKYLESINFSHKKEVQAFNWSYKFSGDGKQEIVVYHSGYIWLNRVAMFMRDEVKKEYGSLDKFSKEERKKLYLKVLSQLSKFNTIEYSIEIKPKNNLVDCLACSTNISSKTLIEFYEAFRTDHLGG